MADVLFVLALHAGNDYLLAEVGVFWVLVRVLACGGLAVIMWLATSGQLQTNRLTEVGSTACSIVLAALTLDEVVGRRHVVPTAFRAPCGIVHGIISSAVRSVSS